MESWNTDRMQRKLDLLSTDILRQLQDMKHCLVLAESCTGGLIAASLTGIPGASSVLAGSCVVYQLPTKTAWLRISAQTLENPGAVSRQVAEEMAVAVLEQTPHATVSLSITGHLGPNSPEGLNGVVWMALGSRTSPIVARKFHVRDRNDQPDEDCREQAADVEYERFARRQFRQRDAVLQALSFLSDQLFST